MRNLVKHWVRENLTEIAKKSLINCHVQGLHSILFQDTPENRIRLFITTPNHKLHLNNEGTLGSLAAHAHHSNITLEVVQGTVINLEYDYHTQPLELKYHPFEYTSGILTSKPSFVKTSKFNSVSYADQSCILTGDSLKLPANQIHSVYVAKGHVTAWFVYEGKSDPNYKSLSYSDQNMNFFSFQGLYKPMYSVDVLALLSSVNLI